ncbi:hypothetical protein [Neobacillus terrae]|uniref:tubby C-terminal domain-like protein n=1 Tax=Neobacillus terrae TaxID=3034837 RepID=UPI00140C570F|nr:hypothetical protein [Neobacillus terrae]NHM30849.1 hypothetical protein [Neobacillus terrae]
MMYHLSYQVPDTVLLTTKIPVINDEGKTIFLLQKQRLGFLGTIADLALRYGVRHCYQITLPNGKPIYSLNSAFPGICYRLTEHLTAHNVPINQHIVQLLELAYSFSLSNRVYYFEKDFKGNGHLKCDNHLIASVSMPSLTKVSMVDTIVIEATTQEYAALAAALFHILFYYNA